MLKVFSSLIDQLIAFLGSSRYSHEMHVVLVSPQIPPNTGNVARLCAATNTTLHLVRPLGFVLNDKQMQRAGLDYWQHVDLQVHDSFAAFVEAVGMERAFLFTTKSERSYTTIDFEPNDVLIFGSELHGLPEVLLAEYADQCATIPMPGPVRSLNLSTSVGIVLYHALHNCSLLAK